MRRFTIYIDWDHNPKDGGMQGVFYPNHDCNWHDVIGAKIIKMEVVSDQKSIHHNKMMITLEK